MKRELNFIALAALLVLTTACGTSSDDPIPSAPTIQEPTGTKTPIFGTVTDIDGNTYQTVTLGTQTWMAENLRVTKFNDGTPLKNLVDAYAWRNTKKVSEPSIPAYCWYKNDSANHAKPFGAYYNSFVVDTRLNGNKNIAPLGWHVADDLDWSHLRAFLEINGYGFNGTGNICKALASTADSVSNVYGWNPTVKEYAVGTKPELNNKSGFNAFANGARDAAYDCSFYKQGVNAFWWQNGGVPFVLVGADAILIDLPGGGDMSEFGMGIRCIKD